MPGIRRAAFGIRHSGDLSERRTPNAQRLLPHGPSLVRTAGGTVMRKPAEMTDLDRLRHSTAHVLAQAVTHLFPETKMTIGPPTDDGFYYDFDRPTPFTPEDLESLEAEMAQSVSR